MLEQVVGNQEPFVLGMPRRVFTVRALGLLIAVVVLVMPWLGVEGVLRSEGYPDRATFEWLQVTRATKHVVLVHMGAPSLRLANPTLKQLTTLQGVHQSAPSALLPQGDVWVYDGTDVAFRPDTLSTTYVYFTPAGRVCNIAFAFWDPDLHGPEDSAASSEKLSL